jgi:hypothetical protein
MTLSVPPPDATDSPIGGVASAPIKPASLPVGSVISTAETSASNGEAADRLDFLWKIHGYTNDYIRFADTKAGLAAATVLAVMGALVAAHPFDSISETPIAQQHYRVWFASAAIAILAFSFICTLLAIRPRLKSEVPKGFIFWESVIAHNSDLAFASECKKLVAEDMELNVSRHIYALAGIATRKYFWTNLSILSGSIGGLLAGGIILAIHTLQPK